MSEELISKKADQIRKLLDSLEKLVAYPFEEFQQKEMIFRSAERNFQLIVDTALDINAFILLEHAKITPDTYRQSFLQLKPLGIFNPETLDKLADSAGLRNILVHEYDFDSDNQKFYNSAKTVIPAYREYLKAVLDFLNN